MVYAAGLRLMQGASRWVAFMLLLVWGSIAGAAGSYIGIGPTTEMADALRPVIRSLEEPTLVKEAPVKASDLVDVKLTTTIDRPITVGVQESLGWTQNATWLRFTLDEMNHTFGANKVKVLWLDDDGLLSAVRNRQVDFFICNSDMLVQLQTTAPGVDTLASFLPSQAHSAEDAQGSVIFIRKMPNEALHMPKGVPVPEPTILSLKGRSGAAMNDTSLEAWLAAQAQAQRRGIDPMLFKDQVSFYGNSPEAVINAVLTGSKYFGVLPTCVLEAFERSGRISIARDIKVITPQASPRYYCEHSTPLYPSWSVGAVGDVDGALRKAMSSVLFAMNNAQLGGEWTLPAINRSVYDLFYELKLGPYAHLASWNIERFMRENANVLALVLLLIFVIISYSASLQVMVRRRTKELSQALEERDLIEIQAQQSREHIAKLEQTGIVGQMSTIIAHELKQPLSAIVNYANGLHRRTVKGRFDQESFDFALGEIVNEAERANVIVNRVRAYAKHDYPPRTVTDLGIVIRSAINTFRRSRQSNAKIILQVNPRSLAEVDSWEIELAVLNLLKNAADATQTVPNPEITVSLTPKDAQTWALSVADNGPYLSDEAFSKIFTPLETTKGEHGLGLGLSIVASIAERHAGRVTVERAGAQGVKFTLTVARIADPGEEIADSMLPARLLVLEAPKTPRTEEIA